MIKRLHYLPTSQITHVSSKSFSSDTEDSYEPMSKPESRNFESPISVTPLATKFPSPRRKTLQPSGVLEENLDPDKMSDDSQLDEGGMREENPSPSAASKSSPEKSREELEGVGHHLTGSEESSNSQKMGFEELDRVVRTATLR